MVEQVFLKNLLLGVLIHDLLKILDSINARPNDVPIEGGLQRVAIGKQRKKFVELCHFTKISRGHFSNCDAVVTALNKKWSTVCKTAYDKADQDIFDRLSSKLSVAREQALDIDLHHLQMKHVAHRTNPSAQVYELIAILTGAHTGEKCPIAGTWELVGDPNVTTQLNKGDEMPLHNDSTAYWQLPKIQV